MFDATAITPGPHLSFPETPYSPMVMMETIESAVLVTSDLSLWDRSYPRDSNVDGNGYDANNPDRSGVVGSIGANDDGEDDAAEIANPTSETRNDTYSCR